MIFDTQEGIDYFSLSQLKAALKLEKVGLKHSAMRGKALRPQIAKHFGLKPRDSYDLYIAAVQAKMDAILRGEP